MDKRQLRPRPRAPHREREVLQGQQALLQALFKHRAVALSNGATAVDSVDAILFLQGVAIDASITSHVIDIALR